MNVVDDSCSKGFSVEHVTIDFIRDVLLVYLPCVSKSECRILTTKCESISSTPVAVVFNIFKTFNKIPDFSSHECDVLFSVPFILKYAEDPFFIEIPFPVKVSPIIVVSFRVSCFSRRCIFGLKSTYC